MKREEERKGKEKGRGKGRRSGKERKGKWEWEWERVVVGEEREDRKDNGEEKKKEDLTAKANAKRLRRGE